MLQTLQQNSTSTKFPQSPNVPKNRSLNHPSSIWHGRATVYVSSFLNLNLKTSALKSTTTSWQREDVTSRCAGGQQRAVDQARFIKSSQRRHPPPLAQLRLQPLQRSCMTSTAATSLQGGLMQIIRDAYTLHIQGLLGNAS